MFYLSFALYFRFNLNVLMYLLTLAFFFFAFVFVLQQVSFEGLRFICASTLIVLRSRFRFCDCMFLASYI